jgi:hypothetical protein
MRHLLGVALLAACGGGEAAPATGLDPLGAAFTETEADLGEDLTCALLLVANIGGADSLELDVGLDAGPAQGIVAYRRGADGVAGTADDERYETLAELDAIPYVGPIALGKMRTYVAAQGVACVGGEPPGDDPVPQPPGTTVDALVNGDFAAGTAGWTFYDLDGMPMDDGDVQGYVVDGELRIDSSVFAVCQPLSFSGDITYRARWRERTDVASDGGFLVVYAGSESAPFLYHPFSSDVTDGWLAVDQEGSFSGSSSQLCVTALQSTGTYRFDDFSFTLTF